MKKSLRALLSLVSVAFLLSMFAVSAGAEGIPVKPENNVNLVTGAPVITQGDIYAYNSADAKLTSKIMSGSYYPVEYPLDTALGKDDTFVVQADILLSDYYDEYRGPCVLFRKSDAGVLYGVFFQQGAVYLGSFTPDADGKCTFAILKGIGADENQFQIMNPFTWNKGEKATVSILSTPTTVMLSVKKGAEDASVLFDSIVLADSGIGGAKPTLGVIAAAALMEVSGCMVYDTKPAPAPPTTGTTTAAATTAATEKTTTTTMPDVGPTTVPTPPAGAQNLISNSTGLRSASENFTYKGGILKAATYSTFDFASLDLSKSGLSAQDTYLMSAKVKITSHYGMYSGMGLAFRGKNGGDFYSVSIQTNQIYILKYKSTNYAGGGFDVLYQVPFAYVDNQEIQIDVFSKPNKFSIFVDGKLLFDYLSIGGSDPMMGFISSNADYEVSNMKLYKMAAGSGNAGGSPSTGDSRPEVWGLLAIVALTLGGICTRLAVSGKKTRAR